MTLRSKVSKLIEDCKRLGTYEDSVYNVWESGQEKTLQNIETYRFSRLACLIFDNISSPHQKFTSYERVLRKVKEEARKVEQQIQVLKAE
jgi:hypothetical protein